MAEIVDNELKDGMDAPFDDGIGPLDEPEEFDSSASSSFLSTPQRMPKNLPTIRPISPRPAFGVFLVFLVSFVGSFIVALIGVLFAPEASTNYVVTLLSDLPVIFVCCWVLYQWLPWKPKIMPITLPTLFGAAALFAFVWLSGQAAGIWMNTNFTDPAYGTYTEDLNALSPVVYFVLTLCVAPVMEELFFRGVCERAFAYYITPFWAIVFQALIFGVMHLTFIHLIPTILLGLFNGWLTYRTGKIWPCIVLHALNNALAIFAIDAVYEVFPWLFDDVLAWAGACIVAGATVLLCMDAYQSDGGLLVRRRPIDFVQVSNEILDVNGDAIDPFEVEPPRANLKPRARVIGQELRPRRYDAPEAGSESSQDPWPY